MGADALPDEADGLLALAEECSLSATHARKRMSNLTEALAEWRHAARKNNIREHEIAMMAESIQPRLEAVTARAEAITR